jgi:3-hydroxybutyryl-CoA dehydrogenase
MTDQMTGQAPWENAVPFPARTTVAVVGAGTMGSGIAQVAATAGHQVKIFDTRAQAISQGIESVKASLRRGVARGQLSEQAASAAVARIVPVSGLDAFADAGLVIEAIVEDLQTKREIFRQLEKVVSEDCLLATNTSSLSVTELAVTLGQPGRFVGIHFFNPAPLMELIEIVIGLSTSPKTVAIAGATARAWNKIPVLSRSTPGFIVNRIARPFYAEALRLLTEQAADIATIDELVRESGGFAMGPFELMDFIGNDINFAVTQSVFQASFFDSRFRPSFIQQELVQSGFFGRKSGRGFYRYTPDADQVRPVFEPAARTPEKAVFSEAQPANALLERVQSGFPHATRSSRTSTANQLIQTGNALLCLTDGRTASQLACELRIPNVVLLDLAFDYGKARTLAVARADQCTDSAYHSMVGLLQAGGFNVIRLRDLPALAVMRMVTMIINEAADAVHYGVSSRHDIDLAMRKGANYPCGPFAWSAKLGTRTLRQVLKNLAASYGEDRYRISPLVDQSFWSGRRLDESPN